MLMKNPFPTLGSSAFAIEEREINDFYATEPKATELLLEQEQFQHNIWECCCGKGHISDVLKKNGYSVYSTDLIDRGYSDDTVDFLTCTKKWRGDIITNPPYKNALLFIKHGLELIEDGSKLAVFLKLQFLEGQERRKFYNENPPKIIYVASKRLICAKNGEFEKYKSSTVAYAWYVWEKGFNGYPTIKWIN